MQSQAAEVNDSSSPVATVFAALEQIRLASLTPVWLQLYRVRHKSINTPLSHERLVGSLQDGGRGTHVPRTALPPTTIYCEPGVYDMLFVG